MKANKYYVVWKGFAPGVYDSWEEAEIQVSGYPDAQYKAFKSQEAAIEAFREGYDRDGLIQEVQRQVKQMQEEGAKIEWKEQPQTKRNLKPIGIRNVKVSNEVSITASYIQDALAVDAACSGNPGPMEYRGVIVRTGQEIFRVGPLQGGTNNIGEFLAIVHGLALQEQQGTQLPLYSDSVNAQLWIRNGKCKTTLKPNEENATIFDMINRAERWLATHTFRLPIYKWDTKKWGEIPADFGRK
ncbi:MAG: ribonuclease H family protein [Bacteroidales bacterium]|nr:ribonuclease H family protein [Bacteroidales bacterium]